MKKLEKDKPLKVGFVFPPPWDPKYPSYALALFKASTKKLGHEFFGFDLNVDLHNFAEPECKNLWGGQVANKWDIDSEKIIQNYSKFLDSYIDKIIESEINICAISINIYSKHIGLYIAQKIKEKNPKVAILLGGPHCFPAYEGIGILSNKYIDAICTGEGDLLWQSVLDHFNKNKNLQIDLPGISYKRNDGSIVDNGMPEIVTDLNSVPFADYSDIDFEKYGNSCYLPIMTSRGCINTCAFCSERPNFFKYRFRTAENIFNEVIKHIADIKNNPTFPSDKMPDIRFNDSLINGSPKELEKFCDMVIDNKIKFRWGGMALIRKEMTLELMAKMRKAGCRNLAWGMESASQRVLDLMHKRFFTMDLAKNVIKSAHEVGLVQSISLIAGFPGETEEMFLETKEFIKEHKDYVTFGIQPMMIASNSLVSDKPEKFGLAPQNDGLKWESLDGTNTYDVRLKRVELIRSILEDNLITIDK